MGIKIIPEKKVCSICGKSRCNGKEYSVHLKYNYYGKVNKHITVCDSQVSKEADIYLERLYYNKKSNLDIVLSRAIKLENMLNVSIKEIEKQTKEMLKLEDAESLSIGSGSWECYKNNKNVPKKYYYKVVHAMGAEDKFEAKPI